MKPRKMIEPKIIDYPIDRATRLKILYDHSKDKESLGGATLESIGLDPSKTYRIQVWDTSEEKLKP